MMGDQIIITDDKPNTGPDGVVVKPQDDLVVVQDGPKKTVVTETVKVTRTEEK